MFKIVAIYDDITFSNQIEYTLNLIFNLYGIKYGCFHKDNFSSDVYNQKDTLIISYGKKRLQTNIPAVHIFSSSFFGEHYLKPQSMPETPLKRYQDIPVIYTGTGNIPGWVYRTENSIETNIDIIASSFFMVSRYEEVIIDIRDEHDRFPATASLAYKEVFLERPIVNEYVELLWRWMKELMPGLKRTNYWPDGKDLALCLTHDVDTLRKYHFPQTILSVGYRILVHRKPKEGLKLALHYASTLANKTKDPLDTFDIMLEIEKKCGFKSSFYFMNRGNEYNIREKHTINLVKKIEESGCEAGLHGGYSSYNNLNSLKDEKVSVDKVLANQQYGCRQHFLRWKTPDTWRIQEQLGILYDTTLSYADHAGFRCGICFPFKPFDVIENREINIWEIPLIVMDGSLQNPKYQNLSPEAAFKQLIKLCNMVEKSNGLFTLLWHNSSFDESNDWFGWRHIYEDFLGYICKRKVYSSNGREIIEWWENRISK